MTWPNLHFHLEKQTVVESSSRHCKYSFIHKLNSSRSCALIHWKETARTNESCDEGIIANQHENSVTFEPIHARLKFSEKYSANDKKLDFVGTSTIRHEICSFCDSQLVAVLIKRSRNGCRLINKFPRHIYNHYKRISCPFPTINWALFASHDNLFAKRHERNERKKSCTLCGCV